MPNLPAPAITFALAAATVALTVGLALAVARDVRRRERHRRRIAVAAFARSVMDFLERRIDDRALRAAARDTDVRDFWTVLDAASGRARGARRRLISVALERNRHSVLERRLLRSEPPERRELAAHRLGLLRSKRSRLALHRAMLRGPESVTAACLRALARDRDPRALAWALDHPDRLHRRTVARWIAILRGFGRQAPPLLAKHLESGIAPTRLRRAAIEVLGLSRYRAATSAIERHLSDPDADVRVAAARALGRLGSVASAAALTTALGDEAWPVRALSAWALGRTGATTAAEPLAGLMTDASWWVRRHAAYALAELGARDTLSGVARSSEDRYAREIAQEALDMTELRTTA